MEYPELNFDVIEADYGCHCVKGFVQVYYY